jgi:hypothetical protein
MSIQMRFLSFLLLLFFAGNTFSQSIADSVYNPNIKTIQLYKEGWELSYPVLVLNSNDKIKISFDDFNQNIQNYSYTLVQCNSNWEPTSLNYSEYVEGFEQNQILVHQFSINTVLNYIHYSFSIPNENCKPRISGNYIVKVFADNNPAQLLFTRKFFITESAALIDFNLIRPEIPKYMMKYQQFNLVVRPILNDFTDLRSEIHTVVLQNNNPASIKNCYLSKLDNNNTLYYDDPDSNIFAGGNEFRNFDIKSIKYQSARIKRIAFAGTHYNIDLHPDESRYKKQYFSDEDINGQYFIANSLGTSKDIDADYVQVYISLLASEPVIDGNLYVLGSLTNWQCNAESKMNYNLEKGLYEIQILLKQGYYNYVYAYKPNDNNAVDLSYVEGNHYETENDYQVFVYYKPYTSRYERLIGFKLANSIKKGN